MSNKYMVLKGTRVSHGLTQKDMGQIIGKSESSYRKKENGIIQFNLQEVRAIGKHFKKPLDQLFI